MYIYIYIYMYPVVSSPARARTGRARSSLGGRPVLFARETFQHALPSNARNWGRGGVGRDGATGIYIYIYIYICM